MGRLRQWVYIVQYITLQHLLLGKRKYGRRKEQSQNSRKRKIQLTEQSRPHIKGVQAQLFSETIGSFDMVQYYVFPKIFGLVERGWNAYPEWSPVPNDDKQALYEKARAIYNAKIAEIELPCLAADGFNFRGTARN